MPRKIKLETASEKMRELNTQMNEMFFEREKEINALFRAIVAEENVVYLGTPGTAKTEMVKVFSESFAYRNFTTLLMRNSKTEDVFGPIDVDEFKKGRRVRKVQNYLPDVEIGFTDEIFKCNPTVLNGLLTILNERQFHNGCAGTLNVPLKMLVGASNEYPEDDSLNALYDRFVLRCWVDPIKDRNNFIDLMMDNRRTQVDVKVDSKYVDALREYRKKVDIAGVINAIAALKEHLDDSGMRFSDRRWKKAVKVVKTNAVLRGELVANNKDLLVLSDVLWNKAEERAPLMSALTQYLGGNTKAALKVVSGIIEKFKAACQQYGVYQPDSWDLDACNKVLERFSDVAPLCQLNLDLNEPVNNLSDLADEDPDCKDMLTEAINLHTNLKSIVRKKIGV